MNKLLLLGGLLAFSAAAAQASPNLPTAKLWMESKESVSELDFFGYTYNEANQCDSTYTYRLESGYDMYVNFGFRFNEIGLQVAEEGYQRLKKDGSDELADEYTNTMRVNYVYDSQNRLFKRLNYNRFGGWELGGVYVYYYENEKLPDQPSSRRLFWDTALTSLFEEVKYEYNEAGLIAREVYSQANWETNAMEESTAMEYVYDKDNRLTYRNRFHADPNKNNELVLDGVDRLTYDANGDIVEELWYVNSPNNPTQRITYTFRPEFRSDVAYPIFMEEDTYNMEHSVHAIDTETTYAVDENSGSLQLYDVYNYVYSSERPMRSESGINETMAQTNSRPTFRYADGVLSLDNFAGFQDVTIVDMAGRVVARQSICSRGNVALDNLTPGVYCAVAGERTFKFAVR